jgi:hypothetical protein
MLSGPRLICERRAGITSEQNLLVAEPVAPSAGQVPLEWLFCRPRLLHRAALDYH